MGARLNAWMGSAACKDADPDLFTLHEFDGYDRSQAFREENEARFKLGLAYCEHCPVIQECGDSASPTDFKNTVRGGRSPYSTKNIFTPAQQRRAEAAWEGYRRGQKVIHLGPPERTLFNSLREAYMASTPEVEWPKYRPQGRRDYQRAGRGTPLWFHENRDVYTIMAFGGKRWDRLTIEAKHVVSVVPV